MSEQANTKGSQSPFLEFTPRADGDVVDDAVMSEVVRRLRLASLGDPGASQVAIGFGSTVSDASGNQAVMKGGGIFVPLGAGLGVKTGQGLFLNEANQVELVGNRVFSQLMTFTADGEKTFTLPESVDHYAVSLTPLDPIGTAKIHVSSRSATAVKITVTGFSVAFDLEIATIEIL